jgi:hypothetical protein
MSTEELLEAEVLIYLRGLGLPNSEAKGSSQAPLDDKPSGPWGKPK